ncbi:MAG: hypothetical protein HY685_05600 [Chloroflexi bacterium]|nr:hypothetical protein [Chloroflexota bacterium]
MPLQDIAVLLMRWGHVLAAVGWIGGNIFYFAVLRPILRDASVPGLGNRLGGEFKGMVELSIWLLLITGAVLLFDRIAGPVRLGYAIVLAAKLGLSSLMFLTAFSLGRRGPQRRASPLEGRWAELLPEGIARRLGGLSGAWDRLFSPTNLLLVLGPVVILLSLALRLFT